MPPPLEVLLLGAEVPLWLPDAVPLVELLVLLAALALDDAALLVDTSLPVALVHALADEADVVEPPSWMLVAAVPLSLPVCVPASVSTTKTVTPPAVSTTPPASAVRPSPVAHAASVEKRERSTPARSRAFMREDVHAVSSPRCDVFAKVVSVSREAPSESTTSTGAARATSRVR